MDNQKFSEAVHNYVIKARQAEAEGKEKPQIPNYIGKCFLDIATNMTNTPKFIRRTYKELLINDAVEDCIKRIHNYNIDAETRTGKPNAFAYFTQICYFSFLRTVAKYNKEIKKRMDYTEQKLHEMAMDPSGGDPNLMFSYLDDLRMPYQESTSQKDHDTIKSKKPKNLEKFMGEE